MQFEISQRSKVHFVKAVFLLHSRSTNVGGDVVFDDEDDDDDDDVDDDDDDDIDHDSNNKLIIIIHVMIKTMTIMMFITNIIM